MLHASQFNLRNQPEERIAHREMYCSCSNLVESSFSLQYVWKHQPNKFHSDVQTVIKIMQFIDAEGNRWHFRFALEKMIKDIPGSSSHVGNLLRQELYGQSVVALCDVHFCVEHEKTWPVLSNKSWWSGTQSSTLSWLCWEAAEGKSWVLWNVKPAWQSFIFRQSLNGSRILNLQSGILDIKALGYFRCS